LRLKLLLELEYNPLPPSSDVVLVFTLLDVQKEEGEQQLVFCLTIEYSMSLFATILDSGLTYLAIRERKNYMGNECDGQLFESTVANKDGVG
jgi:hypothetical protein